MNNGPLLFRRPARRTALSGFIRVQRPWHAPLARPQKMFYPSPVRIRRTAKYHCIPECLQNICTVRGKTPRHQVRRTGFGRDCPRLGHNWADLFHSVPLWNIGGQMSRRSPGTRVRGDRHPPGGQFVPGRHRAFRVGPADLSGRADKTGDLL